MELHVKSSYNIPFLLRGMISSTDLNNDECGHACESLRKKWGEWTKCLESLEQLQLEFELAQKPAFKEFTDDLTNKIADLVAFKKTVMTFTLSLEKYMKEEMLHTATPTHHSEYSQKKNIYFYILYMFTCRSNYEANMRAYKHTHPYMFACMCGHAQNMSSSAHIHVRLCS